MDAQGRPPLDAARLVEILDGVPVLLYVQDPEGRITYANQVACDLVGKSPGDVVGRIGGEPIALSASIVICLAPVEGRTREELLNLADAAMYRAKAGGPGRYVIGE